VEKVVAIAKMSPGIVRFYFDSKAAMLVASLQFLSAEFEDQLLVPVSKLKSNPVAALELMVDLYLDPEIASPRKVSVWYAFWGEASSRQEYYDICGQKDEGFTVLVRELIGRMIEDSGQSHLECEGVALGLIGVLEMLWQDFAFRSEEDIDRVAAKQRCMAYLRSVFPGQFAGAVPLRKPGASSSDRFAGWVYTSPGAYAAERDALLRPAWQAIAHGSELERAGDFVAADLGVERALAVRDSFGEIRALRNSCPRVPHTLVSPGPGRLERALDCAVHGLKFNAEGRGIEGDGGDLEPLEARAAGGFQWIRAASATPHTSGEDALAVLAEAPWTGAAKEDRRSFRASPDIEVHANWKLLTEVWLEALDHGSSGEPELDATGIEWTLAPIRNPTGWSAARYRSLMRSGEGAAWSVRFVAPHQWIEWRPDGISLLQIIANGPLRCRVRRLNAGSRDEASGALHYLAGRIAPRCRAATIAIAESAQQGVSEFGYRTSRTPASNSVAWFRRYVTSRLPELAAERPPNEIQ
jgi:TetR/AcrR family transcriptional repressor of bet genes